ncbi:MAG: DUF1059 domain-containing protein [Nitrospirota bacterium]
MTKVFQCSDLGVECKWKGMAQDEKELLVKVAEHASKEHGMKELTEVIRNKIKARIREE